MHSQHDGWNVIIGLHNEEKSEHPIRILRLVGVLLKGLSKSSNINGLQAVSKRFFLQNENLEDTLLKSEFERCFLCFIKSRSVTSQAKHVDQALEVHFDTQVYRILRESTYGAIWKLIGCFYGGDFLESKTTTAVNLYCYPTCGRWSFCMAVPRKYEHLCSI